MGMDTEALLTFLAIHETGGFSSAAVRLHRSQPAISRRIALLEQELGMPLFERVRGGVALSEAGDALLPHARRVMAALKDCDTAMDALRAGSAGSLSVAVVGTLAGANLTPILDRFSSAHPHVDLRLRTATSAEVSELVRCGEVSIGLRYHLDPSAELDCAVLPSEPVRVVCGAKHPLAGRRIRNLHRLAAERWLAFPNALRNPETAPDNLFAQFQVRGIANLNWVPIDSLTAQKRLVEAGYGLAVLPESAITEELRSGTLAAIVVVGLRLASPVCLVTRKGGYLSPAALSLVQFLHHMHGRHW
jgi:DNA-binding transcriptional LysR family regulator